MEILLVTVVLVVVVILAIALVAFAVMFWRMANDLISAQNTQHQQQVDADKQTAQALFEMGLYVKESVAAFANLQAILSSIHRDISELSGDASRNQVSLENRLEIIHDKQSALLDLIGEMYQQINGDNEHMRHLLDTLATEVRNWIGTRLDSRDKAE